jgi:quinol monooxygenase YgiN
MIHVVAVITAKPGQREAVLEVFRANLPAVHAEEGCIEYVPVVDVGNGPEIMTPLGPDSFMVIEKWESRETLAAHAASAHMAAYGARVKDLIASRVIHILADA